MSLRAKFAATASKIFDKFGDVVLDGLFIRIYQDEQPGGVVVTEELPKPVRVVFDSTRRRELLGYGQVTGGDVETFDRMAITLGAEYFVAPSVGDRMQVQGTMYNIAYVDSDPAEATYLLGLKLV